MDPNRRWFRYCGRTARRSPSINAELTEEPNCFIMVLMLVLPAWGFVATPAVIRSPAVPLAATALCVDGGVGCECAVPDAAIDFPGLSASGCHGRRGSVMSL